MKLAICNSFIGEKRGTSAIEFAMVGPIFLLLVMGMIYGCLMIFALASMHDAVEDGARCASVKTTVCSSSATTIAYAQAAYSGAGVTPTFTYSTPACGHAVTATANFNFYILVTTLTVPLSATACFP